MRRPALASDTATTIGLIEPPRGDHIALLSANLINAVGAWVLVYGHFGFPALGTTGSGIATLAARIYMALVLAGAVLHYDRRHHVSLFGVSWLPSRSRLMRLARLGFPAATQVTLELAVFAAASALPGDSTRCRWRRTRSH